VLLLLTFCSFGANMGGRYLDPLVTSIARDFGAPVATVALLSSAFTLPFGLGQPILGPLGDALGKVRVFKVCFCLLGLSMLASVFAPTLPLLFASRIAAGLAAGGIIPIGLALLGDVLAAGERQVAFARFSSGAIIAQIVGLTAAGAIAAAVGWRNALLLPAVLASVAALSTLVWLRDPSGNAPGPLRIGHSLARYRTVFQNPHAIICFITVFAEGVAIYGALPFIVELLESDGRGGPKEAGFVTAGLGLGCILMALGVRPLLLRLGIDNMMRIGGVVAAIGLALLALKASWWMETGFFVIVGFGFFMIHNSLQNRVAELAPTARGSAVAMHYFSFFMGQAAAPVLFGAGLAHAGATASFLISAALIGVTGLAAVAALRAKMPPAV
jgi:predicted MFS family arabinose efflux permease